MNILVCIKQVPDTTEIKIDPVTNTLVRDGVPSIINPFDGYALEAAARIKDKDPDTKIVVLSMGPSQAEAALREALAIAADKAYLVTDRIFGGSDTLATSYILYNAITKVKKTFVPPRKEAGVIIKEETGEESAQKLFTLLSESHVI